MITSYAKITYKTQKHMWSQALKHYAFGLLASCISDLQVSMRYGEVLGT